MSETPMRRGSTRRVLLALLLAAPMPALAQNSVLTGRILDSAGAPVAGAGVRIPQMERSASADSAGRYRFEGLATGRVTIVGEAPGFSGQRVEVAIPADGTVEQSFSLKSNARVLAAVEVRARSRQQLPIKLTEFAMRRNRGAGRFLGPDDLTRFNGKPLVEALKTVVMGARFQRSQRGGMTIVSARSLNPASIRQSTNLKACGVQIWEDGVLLSDPNSSADLVLGTGTANRQVNTVTVGAERDYDVSNLLSNDYMAVEYYSDLASTPPGFRTGTESCGVLVLWTRVPMTTGGTTTGATAGGQQ